MRVRQSARGGIERIERWQDTFMDALDKVGVVVNRDEYWKPKSKSKSKKAVAAKAAVPVKAKKAFLQEAN